jgi:predicted AlkP superfamily phosphohydrolase/phosphomutase
MPQAKVMIIGVDAATLELARPWMEAGRLPNLARIASRGACGPLTTVLPPVSPAAWSTFATGLNPGKHGILTFAQLFADSYEPVFVNASGRRGATFWELAGRRGIRGIIINVPCTYPPREFNGIIISGMLSPGVDERMAAPREAFRELIALSPDYEVDVNVANRTSPRARALFLERALANVEVRRRAAVGFYRAHRPDLFCVVFAATDRVCHYFLGEEADPSDGGDAVLRVYERVDEAIGELMQEAGDDTDFIIMSDHGARPIRKRLSLRKALARAGLLTERRPSPVRGVARGGLLRLVRALPRTWHRKIIARFAGLSNWAMSSFTSGDVDFSRSRAYPAEAVEAVFVNLKGRQPEGIVPPDEYEAVRRDVMQALRELTDPETGRPVAAAVHRREDIWAGPCLERLPDVVMEQADWRYDTKPTSSATADGVFAERQGAGSPGLYDTGRHSREGLLLAMGPHIRHTELDGAGIADVPATVLALLGCPVPEDFDGRVLAEMLTEDVALPGRVAPSGEGAAGEQEELNARDRASVEERLRGLGYL